MKSIILLIATIPSLIMAAPDNGRIKNSKTSIVKVYGNCATCKKNIETAANTKKISAAEWNEETATAILTYDSTKITEDAILKKIALAGYDNQNYLAPDAAYSKLDLCCQYERKQISKLAAQHSDGADMKHDLAAMSSQDINKQAAQIKKENILSAVYLAYFGIKEALIKGDGNAASAKAKELFKAVDAVPMDKLSASQHTIWMKHMKDISYNAEHIKSTTETEHQREHFTKLSIAMYEVMKIIKADYPIYYDHCPMYSSGKGGDWLSKESDIKNPYYGAQMLNCGSTKEVIK